MSQLEINRSSENSLKAVIPIDLGKMEKITKFIHAALDKAILLRTIFRVKRTEEDVTLYFEGDKSSIKAVEKWLKKNLR